MWKTLKYYWRRNLTVVASVAITTAVLTGALLVGDSVRGSLKALTLDRLGEIQHALVSENFFHQQLGIDAFAHRSAAAILLQGSASWNQARASNVQITGIDNNFLQLFGAQHLDTKLNAPGTFPSVVINQALAQELKAKVGDDILLSFGKPSEIHRETILGNRDVTEVVQRNRFTITAVLSSEKMGRFSLTPNQNLPLNAFVQLGRFQRLLRKAGEVNSLLLAGVEPADWKRHLKIQDYGLRLTDYGSAFAIESAEVTLKPSLVKEALDVANALHLDALPVLTYLANKITYAGRSVPYSTVSAISPPTPFLDLQGNNVPPLQPDEILLNEWTARDLKAEPGGEVELTYYVLGTANQLETKSAKFKLKAIVQQTGFAADPNLAPHYPGIEDAASMSDWSPPFPVDLNLIRPQDEEYWDQFRATPKAFVSEASGVQLWSSRFGTYTSVRIPAKSRSAITQELLVRLDPAEFGIRLMNVRAEGLRSSSGATDFGGLFIGFSLFLIVSAVLLVGLLFRLNMDQRKSEIGTLLAIGLRLKHIQTRLLIEGAILSVSGAAIGTAFALLYAWLIIRALESWWIDAIGSSFLSLHTQPLSLIAGFFLSVLISVVTILFSIRMLSRWPAISLMKGAEELEKETKRSRWGGKLALVILTLAILFTVLAFQRESAELFFAGGATLLAGLLASFSYWLRTTASGLLVHHSWIGTIQMAIRNTVRNPGRSLLSVSLVASACFVIIAVGASRKASDLKWSDRNSGTGGFGLIASATVPIYENLKDPLVLANLGLSKPANIYGFRLRPGEDASCLNLYRPEKPRILGVTESFIHRGGFSFQESVEKTANPWSLLNRKDGDTIPAIGDYNSVRWILHKKIGETLTITNDEGKQVHLKFVALLRSSLLQSEILISEQNFLRHFPDRGGWSFFLIESDPQQRAQIQEKLESGLDVYGFDATPAEEKLAAFHAVENTYLSTFQTLGGLGLLLGTLGLGIILIRNVIERRSELATLRAFGYRRLRLGWFVLLENAFLLFIGICAGAIAASVSIAPHLIEQNPDVPWVSLGVTLLIVFGIGMLASIAALRSALRIPLLPALKGESM